MEKLESNLPLHLVQSFTVRDSFWILFHGRLPAACKKLCESRDNALEKNVLVVLEERSCESSFTWYWVSSRTGFAKFCGTIFPSVCKSRWYNRKCEGKYFVRCSWIYQISKTGKVMHQPQKWQADLLVWFSLCLGVGFRGRCWTGSWIMAGGILTHREILLSK